MFGLADKQTGLDLRKPTKALTGARTIVKINGKLAFFAFGVQFSISTMQDEIWGIDNYAPIEYAPKRIIISGVLSCLHIPGRGASKELIQSNMLSFMFHQYITIEIRDKQTDELIFQTNRAVVTNRDEIINADSLATVSLQWKAIGWQDEIKPKIPSDFDEAGEKESSFISGIKFPTLNF